MCEYVLFFLFQFREDLLGQSKKADDMSRVAGLDNQISNGCWTLQASVVKDSNFLIRGIEVVITAKKPRKSCMALLKISKKIQCHF
jgi:hypothetical protein